jgi:hypothetical protein
VRPSFVTRGQYKIFCHLHLSLVHLHVTSPLQNPPCLPLQACRQLVTACAAGQIRRSSVVAVVKEGAYLPSCTPPSSLLLHGFSPTHNSPLHLPLTSFSSFLLERNVVRRRDTPDGQCISCRETRDKSCSHARHSNFSDNVVL